MIYPETFTKKLGFDSVEARIANLCASLPGRSAMESGLQFMTRFRDVSDSLNAVGEMTVVAQSDSRPEFAGLKDLHGRFAMVKAEGSYLNVEDFVDIRSTLACLESITAFFSTSDDGNGRRFPNLTDIASSISVFPEVRRNIDRTINRFGEISDNASSELADIRRRMSSMQASVGSIMRKVMARAIEGGYLEPDTTPVMRSGRLVLPVAPMNKRKVPGIVHDESASGKTFYVEPAELVEANNRIRELQMEERREIVRILRDLTSSVRPYADEISGSVNDAARLDFIMAKALYAIEISAVLPYLSDKCELEWYHAVNPVLDASLRNHGKTTVPLDITLDGKNRILVISGPNAGGKSVCLKTVGLLQYMVQCGILPPVHENSHFGIFENIFMDIGDDQSIEDDLSTYSSHLRNMKFFLKHANESTIVLIDEFGSGTEPQIGGAIAQAILTALNEAGVWGVVTTHYQNLKTMASEMPGMVNGSMLYDRQRMQPQFKLSVGNAGSSFAIEIARKTGLPSYILNKAEEIAGSDYVNMDKFLLDIARDRRYWENKRQQIRQKEKKVEEVLSKYLSDAETLGNQRCEIIADAKKEAGEILARSNASIERTIREIREAQADKERTRVARQRLADERESMSRTLREDKALPAILRKAAGKRRNQRNIPEKDTSIEANEIKVGGYVKMEGQTTVGKVVSIEGKKAKVEFGSLILNVDTDRLVPTLAKPKSGTSGVSFISSQTSEASRRRQLDFSTEIDLRGVRLEEALRQVTYYLDDAVQFNASRVRILHGTGTGALRQGIRQLLDVHPNVTSYRDELPQFGGAGITIVDLD